MTFTEPDYLTIGHVSRDNVPNGAILGGTCSYSALTAHRLGQRTVGITSAGPDLPSMAMLDDIEFKIIPSPESTIFENIYVNGKRHQKWRAKGGMLAYNDIPDHWLTAPIIHLAPLSQEMSPSITSCFSRQLVCVTLQGWLRGIDDDYNVIYDPHPELEDWLSNIDILVLSLADMFGQREKLEHVLNKARVGVETIGPQGCRVYYNGEVYHVPVQPQQEVDPTGAGDIFAAAFFVRYQQTGGDIIAAAQFANACASLSVGKVGMASIPYLRDVEQRWHLLYGQN